MKKFLSYLLLLCTLLNISIEFANLHAKKIEIEYIPDSMIGIDSKKLSENCTKSVIDELCFIDCKDQPLYSDGAPKIEDVKQNQLGVCYFLAAVVSVLSVDPQKIMDCLEDQNDGTVIVNLYDPYKGIPHKIQVEKSIPNLNDYYSFIYNDSPLWIHILLKAFVASKLYVSSRNYKDAEGGFTAPILRMLRGSESKLYNGLDIWLMGRKKLFKKIAEAIENKNNVGCVFSPQTIIGQRLLLEYDPNKELVKNHAYSVVGVFDNNSIAFHNPWGNDKTSSNGIHYMNIDTFFNCCSEIEISSLDPIKKRGVIGKAIEYIQRAIPGLLQILIEEVIEYYFRR